MIKRYSISQSKLYGYVDGQTIYIRDDMIGYDYYATLYHELIHWLIMKIFSNRKIQTILNCTYDMFDALIQTWNLSLVREYYREYYR